MTAGPATIDECLRILTFRGGFNTTVVLAGAMALGVAAGAIGVFALLRKRALMADALSHATLPGIAGAFILAAGLGMTGRSLPILLLGAACTGVLGVLAVLAIVRHSRLPEDTAIGAVLGVFFGAGAVLLSYVQTMPSGGQGGLATFILGQTAALRPADAWTFAAIAAAALATACLLLKEFRIVCFDSAYAAAAGWPVGLIDILMMTLVVVVTVVGLQAVGLILVVALLIIPPAAARFWTDRLGVMLAASAAIGGLAGYLGAAASAMLPDLPAGAVIVLTAGVIFTASMLFAPARGIIARALRRLRLRRSIADQHLLRLLYELAESRGADRRIAAPVDAGSIDAADRAVVNRLMRRGLLEASPSDRAIALTPAGWAEALRITRNHRLWEQYLTDYADIAPSHVDPSADRVEHVLTGELVADLERALARRGRLPEAGDVTPSIHPIGRGDTVGAGA